MSKVGLLFNRGFSIGSRSRTDKKCKQLQKLSQHRYPGFGMAPTQAVAFSSCTQWAGGGVQAVLFCESVSLHSPSWPGTHYVDQINLKLTEIACPCPQVLALNTRNTKADHRQKQNHVREIGKKLKMLKELFNQ